MLRSLALVTVLTLATGCALIPPSRPDLAYYPSPRDPGAIKISHTLYRAAQAVGDDPDYYSFALIQTNIVTSFVGADATFYFSDGLARLPQRHVDALVAQKVAHEILGHTGKQRMLSLSITAGFAVLGIFEIGEPARRSGLLTRARARRRSAGDRNLARHGLRGPAPGARRCAARGRGGESARVPVHRATHPGSRTQSRRPPGGARAPRSDTRRGRPQGRRAPPIAPRCPRSAHRADLG